MNRAAALPLILTVSLALSCGGGTTERLTEPFASIIPSCADTVEAPEPDGENRNEPQNDNRGTSWTRHCKGDDLRVTMTILQFQTVSAATAYVSDEVDVVENFSRGSGRRSDEDYDGTFVNIRPAVDDNRVFLYEDWPYLSDRPPISVTEGYGMDDAIAGIKVVIRTGTYVIDYVAQHKVEVLIVRTGDWFAVLPFEDADMIQALANQTLANRPFTSVLP